MRAFLALELEPPVRDAVAALRERLRASTARVSWVKPENAHVTLRFLGDIDAGQVDALSARLQDAYRELPAFHVEVAGVGCFPNVRQPRVVWVGVRPDPHVVAVHCESEAAARHIGLAPETKKFRPHITLGRLRDPRDSGDLAACLDREFTFHAGDNAVRRVALLESRLSPQGAKYSLIREFPLVWIM